MIASISLCIFVGVIWTLRGWSLHRNFQPYRNPSDWYYYYPFKGTDGLALTILKGMSICIPVAAIAAAGWLVGWSLGCNGWVPAMWLMIDGACVMLFLEGRSVFVTLRWWFFYLTPGARARLRQSWQRDGYSAF
jgi:hypothetical protein